MGNVIKTRIIKIGNSQGVRIPKVVIEQLGLAPDVELDVRSDHLVLRPARRSRAGWDGQFRQMATHADDQLLDPDTGAYSSWDEEEWEWQ